MPWPVRILRVAYAPLFFVGLLWLGIAAQQRFGPVSLGVALVLAIAISFAAEQLAPYEPAFNRSHGDRARDFVHAVVTEVTNTVSVLVLPLLAAITPGLALWPTTWPIAAQLALAILVADCGITLSHYASHRSALLWRFHAVHHSVLRFYGFNGLMKHPLHLTFELACGATPLVLLGMPQDVAWLLAFATALQLLLQHSNVDMRVGPLVAVWAVAPAHRFHHLNRPGEGDVNFALFSSLWDHLLDTYRADPARRFGPSDLGIADRREYPRTYLAQLREPFVRARRIHEVRTEESR